jgi:ABC-type sulfate transport system substrate-binding protein
MMGLGQAEAASPQSILNVSYDPTREFYEDYNAALVKYCPRDIVRIPVELVTGGQLLAD